MGMNEAGKRIVQLRYKKGMTQEQLGQILNVSGQAVSKWENGDSLPDTSLLVNLAQALECTIDYLLDADKSGGVNRFIPMLESEIQGMSPSEKIDLAFRLFKLVDFKVFAEVGAGSGFEKSVVENGMPFVYAGPQITVWWKGKFLCIASKEALKETETTYKDDNVPFDLFSDEWDELLTKLLEREIYFNNQPMSDSTLHQNISKDSDLDQTLHDMMERGILEKGRGGYHMGTRAEIIFRLLGVLFRSVGKPGVLSANFSNPPAKDNSKSQTVSADTRTQ